jgi:uncharacterized membrane protein
MKETFWLSVTRNEISQISCLAFTPSLELHIYFQTATDSFIGNFAVVFSQYAFLFGTKKSYISQFGYCQGF